MPARQSARSDDSDARQLIMLVRTSEEEPSMVMSDRVQENAGMLPLAVPKSMLNVKPRPNLVITWGIRICDIADGLLAYEFGY